jgi:hypothetical protein
MATLRMLEFKCDEETDEVGDDSPYFVFFIGKGTNADEAQLVRIRQPHWDNDVASGDLLKPYTNVAGGIDSNTLVLCALMEEDDNADIVTGNGPFKKIRNDMRTFLKAFAAGGSSSVSQIASKLIPEFRRSLNKHVTNDDLVDVEHLPTNINLKQHGSFSFNGDGGKYRVWFEMV